MNNIKSKIAIYARKSTESEDRQILSIDSQVKELRDFARQQCLDVVEILTESKSAKSPGRPVFNELMANVRKGKFNELLCWKLDRLARNPVDGGALIWAMEKGELKFLHTPQRTFTNNGNDKFWMQLEFGMAKKYVDDLSDNVKRGRRAKIERGWWPGMPPLGYLNDRNNSTIVKDQARFILVRKMWDMMVTGNYPPRRILTIATDEWGLRTRQHKRIGGGLLSLSMIYKLFKNPFYYGMIPYKGALYPGKHKAMISKSEFDRVQELLDDKSRPRPTRHTFAYTGLIKCGECGASVTAEDRINRQGHAYVYYHCTKKIRNIPCSQKYIEVNKLELQISDFIETLSIPSEVMNWAVKLIKELSQDEVKADQAVTESARRRHDACLKEIDELLNMKLRGLLNDNEYANKKNELENERVRLTEHINMDAGKIEQIIRQSEKAFEFASSLQSKFSRSTPDEKRAILNAICSNLILKDRILRMEAKKPFSIIQNMKKTLSMKNSRFEPGKLSLVKVKNAEKKSILSTWCGLVKEVRTFYWENRDKLETLKLPDILQSSRK